MLWTVISLGSFRDEKFAQILAYRRPLRTGNFALACKNPQYRRIIYNFENLDLDELSAEKASEFLFAWAPLKLVGATGSPGNPVAAY